MFGKKPRFSIGCLMVTISILAADCGLLRAVWGTTYTIELAIVSLPILNTMLLGLPKAETRPRSSTFLDRLRGGRHVRVWPLGC